MRKIGTSVAILALSLSAGSAMAQTTPSPTPTAPSRSEAPKAPVTGQIVMQDANTILAKDLIGQTVYTPDKHKIGSISDLILSKDAKTVDGFVVGVGGFLGIGEKSVALKLDRLQIAHDAQGGGLQLTMNAKKEELANAPSFKTKRDQDSERQAADRSRSQPQGGAPAGGMTR
ncbi:MAG: PRC-barrel domain-containing protein [Hyphomicrobiaceae bacterium]